MKTHCALILLAAASALSACDNSPQAQAKRDDRRKFDLCMADLNDPLRDPGAKELIIRPVCERMREDFRKKYGFEP